MSWCRRKAGELEGATGRAAGSPHVRCIRPQTLRSTPSPHPLSRDRCEARAKAGLLGGDLVARPHAGWGVRGCHRRPDTPASS